MDRSNNTNNAIWPVERGAQPVALKAKCEPMRGWGHIGKSMLREPGRVSMPSADTVLSPYGRPSFARHMDATKLSMNGQLTWPSGNLDRLTAPTSSLNLNCLLRLAIYFGLHDNLTLKTALSCHFTLCHSTSFYRSIRFTVEDQALFE